MIFKVIYSMWIQTILPSTIPTIGSVQWHHLQRHIDYFCIFCYIFSFFFYLFAFIYVVRGKDSLWTSVLGTHKLHYNPVKGAHELETTHFLT